MYFLHHFLKKGVKLEYLLNLDRSELIFYKASYLLEQEEEQNKTKALLGKGGS